MIRFSKSLIFKGDIVYETIIYMFKNKPYWLDMMNRASTASSWLDMMDRASTASSWLDIMDRASTATTRLDMLANLL